MLDKKPMPVLAEAAVTSMRDVPVDLDAALACAHWREWASWPVTLRETNDIGRAQLRRALEWLDQIDDPMLQDAVLLALPNILGYARAIVLAALAVGRCRATGLRLVASAPEYAYLQTGEGLPCGRGDIITPPARASMGSLRRLARMASWSGPRRLPRVLLRPDAVAVSHNTLLRSTAARHEKAIGFRHAETFLTSARSGGAPVCSGKALAEKLAPVLLGDVIAL
jgi:hypothetical protein